MTFQGGAPLLCSLLALIVAVDGMPPNAPGHNGQNSKPVNAAMLECAWSNINQHHRNDAPQATIEALAFSLRDGIAALGRSATLRRLSELSPAQLREVAVRVQKFKPEIAQPWKPEEVEVLIVARNRVRA
jgi:hypothetical protein